MSARYSRNLPQWSPSCLRIERQIPTSIAGAAQDLYDQARDSASQVADAATTAARKTAGSFEKALRNTVETQPYTAVVIALGLGWLLGRMHRPL